MAKVHTKIKRRWGIRTHLDGRKIFKQKKKKLAAYLAKATAGINQPITHQ